MLCRPLIISRTSTSSALRTFACRMLPAPIVHLYERRIGPHVSQQARISGAAEGGSGIGQLTTKLCKVAIRGELGILITNATLRHLTDSAVGSARSRGSQT